MSFLEILGAVLLTLLVVALYFGFKIFRWYKVNVAAESHFYDVINILPPIRFEMHESTNKAWQNTDKLENDSATLKQLSFSLEGFYETQQGTTATQFTLWKNAQNSVCAVLYEAKSYADELQDDNSQYLIDFFLGLMMAPL